MLGLDSWKRTQVEALGKGARGKRKLTDSSRGDRKRGCIRKEPITLAAEKNFVVHLILRHLKNFGSTREAMMESSKALSVMTRAVKSLNGADNELNVIFIQAVENEG
ncbi:hypothetical protein V6N12_058057 [Hibiscus sabdariffa]|uniref:Uncharacterized protein n=1 Tax=Hibiscus sabdariffa TaxID=183260 RepID=A0ABR2BCW2_9ROSI